MLARVDWVAWGLLIARVVVIFAVLLVAVMLVIWLERKVIADMQTRIGPTRAGPAGPAPDPFDRRRGAVS